VKQYGGRGISRGPGLGATLLSRRTARHQLAQRHAAASYTERNAINAIQGTAADIIKEAMIPTSTVAARKSSAPLIWIRDELVFDAVREEVRPSRQNKGAHNGHRPAACPAYRWSDRWARTGCRRIEHSVL
jgi:hypothetical protein